MNLPPILQQKLAQALTGLVPDPAPYAIMVKPAQDAKHGDYQANCAMPLKKVLNKEPRAIAQEIVQRLDLGDMLEQPEIAGPGFINLRLKKSWLAAQLQQMARDERLGIAPANPPRTYVIDYSSPNVAKPMHVGHLRSTIIGDALARLLRFLGHKVIADNHLGDWGTQFGMLLFGYKNYLNEGALKADPVKEMARLYVLVRTVVKPEEQEEEAEDKKKNKTYTPAAKEAAKIVAEAARQETAKLHSGDHENLLLWKQFIPWCLEEIDRIYRRLDVHFDCTHGESFYNPMLPNVVENLQKRGIAQESRGAVVIFLHPPPKEGEKGEPPAMIRKKDGAFTYTTSDLATIQYRMEHWKPDAILYVVDFRQARHFEDLFEAARRWGFEKLALEHISFGSVLGQDGKPIKTSEGGGIELEQLLNEGIERGEQVYEKTRQDRLARGEEVPNISAEERGRIAEVVGLGAVKYADLSQNRTSDYKFDWDKMLAMEGNTATYMQYAFVRNRGIFRKGEVDAARFRSDPPQLLLEEPQERALAFQLLRFEEVLGNAASDYKPNLITDYLWDLAKSYSGFFHDCQVLKAPTPELRESRLLLCDLTARTIQKALELLGIKTVERM